MRHPLGSAVWIRWLALVALCGGARKRENLRLASPAPSRGVVAVFLFGETYRDGGQNWRKTETEGTDRTQHLASKSQMDNLIKPIAHAGYNVVCFLATTVNSTSAMQDLLEWYKDCIPPAVRTLTLLDHLDRPRRGFRDAEASYRNYTEAGFAEADYFIVLRPDLILKKDMLSLWNHAKESVAFPFREWCHVRGGHDSGCEGRPKENCWRVPDTIVAFPRRAFGIVPRDPESQRKAPGDQEWWGDHHKLFVDFSNAMYRRSFNSTYQNDTVTFWLKENHDSDSEKDWNPIYAIAGRPENDKDEQCGSMTTIHHPTVDSSPAHLRIQDDKIIGKREEKKS